MSQHWTRTLLPALCLGLAAVLWSPAPASAQVELGASIGLFWPLGGWTSDFGGDLEERRHIAAGIVVGRATWWRSDRLALEGTVGFSPSQVAVTNLGGTQDITAGVLLGSVGALMRFGTVAYGDSGRVSTWDFYGGLGVGAMARGGSAWANTTGTTHPAAIFSLGTRTRIAGVVTLRVRMEDWVSWGRFNKDRPAETLSRIQNDLVGSLGLMISLGGPRR